MTAFEGGVADRLYPFLGREPGDVAALLEDVRRSTETKAREIVALRARLGRELGPRLLACAEALARAAEDGARLFTFGNGGSATDAQAMAALFPQCRRVIHDIAHLHGMARSDKG